MFQRIFLTRLIFYVYIVQLAVNAATLKLDKGGTKGGKVPVKPSGTLLSSATLKSEPSSPPMTCSRKRGNNEGNCLVREHAPWYLQHISQIPWKNINRFWEDVSHPKFVFHYDTSWGKDVIVYAIDTAVNPKHLAFNEGQIEAGAEVPTTGKSTPDPDDHGTGAASVIVGKIGGVACQAKIFPVTLPILSTAGQIAEAINIAVNNWTPRAAKNSNLRAVINVSVGWNDDRYIEDALKKAIAAGMHVVHAAGNSGMNPCYDDNPIGSFRQVKKVGQITVSGVRAIGRSGKIVNQFEHAFNHGSCIDILAPGVDMLIAHGKGHKISAGTSWATALTSGVVAALVSSNVEYRNLNPEDFRKKFMVEFTHTGIVGLPSDTGDRSLTIEKMLPP